MSHSPASPPNQPGVLRPQLLQPRVRLCLRQRQRVLPHVEAAVHGDRLLQLVLLKVDALRRLELLVQDVDAGPDLEKNELFLKKKPKTI